MARLDRVKNLTGLAEWFAGNERLRKLVNLVIVGALLNLAPQHLRGQRKQYLVEDMPRHADRRRPVYAAADSRRHTSILTSIDVHSSDVTSTVHDAVDTLV